MKKNDIKQKTLRYPEEWDKKIKDFLVHKKNETGTAGSVSSFIIIAIREKMRKEKII